MVKANLDFVSKDCQCLYGCFSKNEEDLVFASQSALFFANIKVKNQLNKVCSNLKFNTSFVSWIDKGIIIGTEKGSAFLLNKEKVESFSKIELQSKSESPSEISKKDVGVIYDSLHISDNSNQNKLGPIKSIFYSGKKNYIIIDSIGQAVISTNNKISFLENIEIIKKCSNDTFLISFQNYNKLFVINQFDEFVPRLPPCYFSLQNNVCFYTSKNDLIENLKEKDKTKSIINKIFASKRSNFSLVLRNNVQFLNHILSFYDSLNSISSKIFLKLGNLEMARNVLMKSNRNDKDYVNNLLIASFYNSDSVRSESAKIIVKSLIDNKMINDAVDILLIIKDVNSAAQILFDSAKFKEAYYVLMLCENVSSIDKEIAKKVAVSLIEKKENILLGLKLLSSFGYTQEMLDQLSLF